ncbi:pentapeptide repeat-containing protein [Micromonospora chalcea]
MLSAYVREHTPSVRGKGPSREGATEAAAKPATDVQAALSVLGRRSKPELDRGPIDLSNLDLDGVRLPKSDFRNAILVGTSLFGSDFTAANLSGAKLGSADFGKASLSHANLSGTSSSGIKLTFTELDGVNFRNATMYGAELFGTNLTSADLSGADIRHSRDLESSSLGPYTTGDERTHLPEHVARPPNWPKEIDEGFRPDAPKG